MNFCASNFLEDFGASYQRYTTHQKFPGLWHFEFYPYFHFKLGHVDRLSLSH